MTEANKISAPTFTEICMHVALYNSVNIEEPIIVIPRRCDEMIMMALEALKSSEKTRTAFSEKALSEVEDDDNQLELGL